MHKKTRALQIVCLISIAFFLALVFAGTPPSVNLLSPENNAVFNTTNNITFDCNASDSGGTLRRIDLYSNINGSFSLKNTSCLGELCADSSTALLLHFNNDSTAGENGTLVYDWSGNGNNGTVAGAQFSASNGKFFGTFEFNGTNNTHANIKDSVSLDMESSGSIELWLNTRSIDNQRPILLKGPPGGTPYCWEASYILNLNSGKIELILGEGQDIYTSDKVLAPNTWHHATATWNGSEVNIYVDGVINYSSAQQTPVSGNAYDLWIGATNDPACNPRFFNGSIDELALYNRALSAEEVFEHYSRTLANNATKNWTISNVSDGTYLWNCKSEDNESQSAWADANRTFYVDLHTPPDVNTITLSPNSADDIDPGVIINVTANVTDRSGVSAVILQYLWPTEAVYNAPMSYDTPSGLYFASFTPTISGVWKYRIWANDTLGNNRTMNETNLSVLSDTTWILQIINRTGDYSSTLGATYAYKGTTETMGVLVINNTGDLPLNFGISANPDVATYNDTMTAPVANKSVRYVEVIGTAPDVTSEYFIELTVSATGATPTERKANGTLVSYLGGPYLVATIATYPSSVQQNDTITLEAKVKNIGNETATGVWLNWTLPMGFENTTGNLTKYVGNLSPDETVWNNLIVFVNPASASGGAFSTTLVNASSIENKTSQDSKIVGVSCSNTDSVCGAGCSYSTDSDCPVPTTSGGGGGTSAPSATGGGTASAKYYSIALGSPDKIDANRGNPVRFAINITNPNKDTRIENITYSLTGYSQVLTFGEPKIISAIGYGETKTILFRLEVPNYTRYGEYPLEVTAHGKGTSSGAENSTDVFASRKITIVVRSATENETLSILDAASKSIEPLAALNITMPKILQMLEDARASLKEWDYDAAKELAGKALEAGQSAIKSYGSLRQVESAISEADKYGVDARETKKMYSLAEAAFERGDYARAEERANNAMLAAAIEVSAKVSILKFIHAYYREIILVSIVLAFSLFFIYRKIAAGIIKREISALDKEDAVIRNLIASAKKDYFEKKAITKAEYKKEIYGYETRMNEIKKERSRQILRLASVARPEKVIEGFKKEEKRILGLIEAAQKDYFELGKISKAHYHGTMHELNAELAEVRLGIEELAGQKSGKNAPLALALLAALVLMFLGTTAHAAGDAAGASGAINQAERDILDMQKSGFGIALANDTLNEARLLYAKSNYARAESLAKYVGSIKKTAISTHALVDNAEEKIFEAEKEGLGVSDAKNDFDAGLLALENSDYLEAEELLNSAISKADNALADSAMKGALGRSWLSDTKTIAWQNKKQIAVLLVSLAVVFSAAEKKYKSMKRARYIRRLEDEENAAAQMIRELQKKYFLDGKVGRAEYASRAKRYEEIILRAKKDISVLKGAEKKGNS